MAKKKQALSPEERLAAALVPEEEWPYTLPDGWKWVYLSGILDVSKEKTEEFPPDTKYVGLENIEKDTGRIQAVDAEGIRSTKNIFETGNILYGKLRPYLNKHGIAEFDGVCSPDILVFQTAPSVEKELPNRYFDLPQFISFAVSHSKGINLPRVSAKEILTARMPLPPLPEQHRLVARIESLFAKLDAARDKVQSVLNSHETRKAALLHDAFTGKLTAKWREEQGITFENWHSDTLKNLCEKITDGTHHSPPNAETGDYMYITAKNIKEAGIELDNVTYVTTAVHKEIYSRCDVQKGDVLYIKDGATTGIATVNTLDEPFSLLSSVAVLRPHKDLLLSSYLKHLLNSAEQRSKMIRNMSGNAITRLTLSKIKATSIKVCSLPEQQEIVRILDRLLAREQRARQAAEETLTAIDRMKQAILARAFRGEL